MALKDGDKENFRTLLRAARANHLALIETTSKLTGEYRAVIAAIVWNGTDYEITPFGHLCPGDPLQTYTDPSQAIADGNVIGAVGDD